MKISISLDDDLLRRLDEFADDSYKNRSAVISDACFRYLAQFDLENELKNCFSKLALVAEKIADKGELDEKSKRDFEDIKAFARMFGRQVNLQ